jgi:hypothetical protein
MIVLDLLGEGATLPAPGPSRLGQRLAVPKLRNPV